MQKKQLEVSLLTFLIIINPPSAKVSTKVPYLLKSELLAIQDEIKEARKSKFFRCSMAFDGTPYHGTECYCFIIRFVLNDKIQERLVYFKMYGSSLNAASLATEYNIAMSRVGLFTEPEDRELVIGIMRDRAAVNSAAVEIIQGAFKNAISIPCLAHLVDGSGHHFFLDNCTLFVGSFKRLFQNSINMETLFREFFNVARVTSSETRWWSEWQVGKQIFELLPQLPSFFKFLEEKFKDNKDKLALIGICRKQLTFETQAELAIFVEAGEYFYRATYSLEKDGFLACKVSRILLAISDIRTKEKSEMFPRLLNLVQQHSSSQKKSVDEIMKDYLEKIKPALDYFDYHVQDSCFSSSTKAFWVAEYLDPTFVMPELRVGELRSCLDNFIFLSAQEKQALVDEYPSYQKLQSHLVMENKEMTCSEIFDWWVSVKTQLPCWYQLAIQVAVLKPTSASAERVFSILKNNFSHSQEKSLEDLYQTVLMSRCNYLWRK